MTVALDEFALCRIPVKFCVDDNVCAEEVECVTGQVFTEFQNFVCVFKSREESFEYVDEWLDLKTIGATGELCYLRVSNVRFDARDIAIV